jgi:hypothetical protein
MECGEFKFVVFLTTIATQGVWPSGRQSKSTKGFDLDQVTMKE